MVVCDKCGKPVRYINASRDGGIYMVDVEPVSLIGETGRVLTGFREHICPVPPKCTMENMDNQKCHAYNGGERMNAFTCGKSVGGGY